MDHASKLNSQKKTIILAGVLLALFPAALDLTLVATALPRIVGDFQGMEWLAWVSASYLLAGAVLLPVFSKLSAIYGRKTILLSGVVIFAAGSVLCGMAFSMLSLVVFRGLQGIGAAAITTNAFSLPADLFPTAQRVKVQTLIAALFGLAGIAGPLVGGMLTDQFGWRAIFYFNVPFAILAVLCIILGMPQARAGVKTQINYLGAALFFATALSFLLAMTLDKTTHAWNSPVILALLAISAVFLILFYQVERRHAERIIPLILDGNRDAALITGVSILSGAAFFAAVLYLPLYLVHVQGVSATAAGISIAVFSACVVFSSWLSALWLQATGQYKTVLLTGLGTAVLSFLWLSQMDATTTLWGVRLRLVVLGIAIGPTLPLLTMAVRESFPSPNLGAAERQFYQQLGQAIGVALFGALLTSSLTTNLDAHLAPMRAKLPVEMAAQLDAKKLRNGPPANAASDNMSKLLDEAPANYVRERDLAVRAIRDHDEKASAELQKTPGLTPSMRKLLESGSVDKIVNGQLDAVKSRVYGVIRSGDFDKVTELADDKRYPELQPTLQAITREQLASEKKREEIIAGIDVMIEAARPGLIQVSTERTLSTIVEGFAGSEKKARQSNQETDELVNKAVKSAFTVSVTNVYRFGIPLVVLAFLLMLGVKQGPVRKTN